jgi:hypothetical protein
VQATTNPAWSALLALPYLMEFPHECSEQLFARLYANVLARHVVKHDPNISSIFEQWKSASDDVKESPLFQNPDLKNILLSETPWVRDAQDETTRCRNIARLFDPACTTAQIDDAGMKLRHRQNSEGGWSWFPGGPVNPFITGHIIAGFGKLKRLGVELDTYLISQALRSYDQWLTKELERMRVVAAQNGAVLSKDGPITRQIAYHLYARSFFLNEMPIEKKHSATYSYFLEQAAANWLQQDLQERAHIALALHRWDNVSAPATPQTRTRTRARTGSATASVPEVAKVPNTTAVAIAKSLRARAVSDPELGTHWPSVHSGYLWQDAPIENQALMVELFSEVVPDSAFVGDLCFWLLRQKQTQTWPTTKSTTDAIYALLLAEKGKGQGRDSAIGSVLSADAALSVRLGEHPVVSRELSPGTGSYSARIPGAEITPAMGNITVTKTGTGLSWGSVTWQYHQDIEKLRVSDTTPLKLKKTLWKKVHTAEGENLVLIPARAVAPLQRTPLVPGDTLVVRLELSTDRDMDFVYLKDQRGSGTEPLSVLSGHRQSASGVRYYESTKDTATHFFIERLPAGVHVFEYSVRVQHRGRYESGIAEIQSMYAPEFNAHTASFPLLAE